MFLVVIFDNEECSGFGLDWLDKEALWRRLNDILYLKQLIVKIIVSCSYILRENLLVSFVENGPEINIHF